MIHGTLALMNRAFRLDERHIRTHALRLAVLGFVYLVLLGIASNEFFGAQGLRLFQSISWINIGVILISGGGLFAAVIAEEKEEMTLGLLQLAGVRPLGLLLGKFAPRLITAMMLLAAQIPFVMLAITLGGVGLPQVIAVTACLAAFLWMVANLGLFCSVIASTPRKASLLLFVLLGLYFGGMSIVWGIAEALHSERIVSRDFVDTIEHAKDVVFQTTPVYELARLTSTGTRSHVVTLQSVSNMVLGAALFALAWIATRWCLKSAEPPAPRRLIGYKSARGKRGRLVARRCWDMALAWKDFHYLSGGFTHVVRLYSIAAFLVALSLFWPWWAGLGIAWQGTAAGLIGISTTVCMVHMGVLASRFLAEEVRWNTLADIVLLPTSLGALIWQKVLGCLLAAIPYLVLIAIGFLMVLFSTDDFGRLDLDIFPFVYVVLGYVTFLHLAALISLYVKRGAFAIALVAMWLGNVISMIFGSWILSGMRGADGFTAWGIMMATIMLILIPAMQVLIIGRVKTLAGQ